MNSRQKSVLLFEDNQTLQQLLKYFFQKHGYDAAVAGDGVDAVALAREHKPSVILMDILMPGKDGIQACADLRKAGIKTPIIVLTSKAMEAERLRAMAAGADTCLFKPFDPAALEATMEPLLGR